MSWILKSQWIDTDSPTGAVRLILTGQDEDHLPKDSRLAYTAITRIPPQTILENAKFVARTANYHEIAPLKDCQAGAEGVIWDITIPQLSHRPAHFTDGPSCAFLIHADGSTEPVQCETFLPEDPAYLNDGARNVEEPEIETAGDVQNPALGLLPLPEVARIEEWHSTPPEGFILADNALCDRMNGLLERLFSPQIPLFSTQPKAGWLEVNLGYYEDDEDDEEEDALVELAEDEEDHQEHTSFLLDFSPDHVLVTTNEGEACLYALIALAQLLLISRQSQEFAFPSSGMIIDSPRFDWRGMHLDVARQVYSKRDILDFLDILAWNRFNKLHLHLSDDEGWRLESLAYPRLCEIGAWRGHGLPLKPQHGSGSERHGGFFRRDEILEIINHARELEIEIIPEIDIPGHCYAALMAVPELVDPSALGGGASVQGYVNNALNPGLAATWRFLEALFDEVAELFPSTWIHVGGDEVAANAWSGSAAACSWARAKGLLDDEGNPDSQKMQAAIMQFVEEHLHKHGKTVLGWEEAANAQGLTPGKSPIMAWTKAEKAKELAQQGYDVILCPGEVYYLDMAQSEDWQEPGLSWAGTSSAEQTYAFEPLLDAIPEKSLLGIQGCIWSENLTSIERFNHMVFPRLSAIAESAWSDPEKKDWASFNRRQKFMPIMTAQNAK